MTAVKLQQRLEAEGSGVLSLAAHPRRPPRPRSVGGNEGYPTPVRMASAVWDGAQREQSWRVSERWAGCSSEPGSGLHHVVAEAWFIGTAVLIQRSPLDPHGHDLADLRFHHRSPGTAGDLAGAGLLIFLSQLFVPKSGS